MNCPHALLNFQQCYDVYKKNVCARISTILSDLVMNSYLAHLAQMAI